MHTMPGQFDRGGKAFGSQTSLVQVSKGLRPSYADLARRGEG